MIARTSELLSRVEQRLAALADPEFREGQQHFFQDEVKSYGVRGDELHAIAREVYREVKKWPAPERDLLMEGLWKLGKLEGGSLVCHVCKRFSKEHGAAEFRLFEQWVDRFVRNWAHADGVASWLLAGCIANEPELRFELRAWTTASNRWKRRASAVALLQEAKHGRNTDFIFEVADALVDDRDDMVEKGVGWLLKETYPAKPAETVDFLLPRRARASRTTLRYAAEKMTAADRARVLD